MEINSLFTLALGLTPPWEVVSLTLDAKEKRLDIELGFPRGSEFRCPECGALGKVHDTAEHAWRHLSFFVSVHGF